MYIMIANNASFAPSKLDIFLLIIPQGLQLRKLFKMHVKAKELQEKIRLSPTIFCADRAEIHYYTLVLHNALSGHW